MGPQTRATPDGALDRVVVPLETNTTFGHSYLVGLNTGMGRDLLWRDYPAHRSGRGLQWPAFAAPDG